METLEFALLVTQTDFQRLRVSSKGLAWGVFEKRGCRDAKGLRYSF